MSNVSDTLSRARGDAQTTEHAKTTASFDPASFLLVPAKRFEDLKIGDVFRAPSRTLTKGRREWRRHNQRHRLQSAARARSFRTTQVSSQSGSVMSVVKPREAAQTH
jgi:hypothetical protein